MKDPRIALLAERLLGYSIELKPGDKVLIAMDGTGVPLATALVNEAYRRGAFPYVNVKVPEISRSLALGTSEEHLSVSAAWDLAHAQDIDAYVSIRGSENSSELADVPPEKHQLLQKASRPWRDVILAKPWVLLNYPNASLAQKAGMSTEAFTDFYFDVCTLDYARLSAAMDPLVELMGRTDRVRITGPGTDLSFSIKGLPVIKCSGRRNIPDGEVYSAPVRDSVNGVISYNVPSTARGFRFAGVRFEFQDGRIVKAEANDTAKLNGLLDTDEGARFIGEFALGVNPYILEPMDDTLYDEKICGSFHFTPGNSYATCDNGNKSAIHWDLVAIQRPEYGGGEIWFDDRLVRKDGLFVLPELAGLNPDRLTAAG